MAADKLNKHSKASNDIRHTSWEIQKVKKKKYSHYDLNTISHISLEWDDKEERVVSKKEQISISHRELTPFLPFVAHHQNVLGDVVAVPPELFNFVNLAGLLSYEVWQTHLSAQEIEFLTCFLPEGADPHKTVHELLAGNNFFFGNPFLKWGASVCSGDYHPDAILRQEQRNKANKVAYYSELHEYHTKMIGSLQSWKERWTISMNPGSFMQKIPRPKRDFHKSESSHETGLQYGPQHDLCATSGSCSWDADDKSCNSDSPDISASNGETLVSAPRTDLGNKYYNSSGGRSVARPKKGDKPRNLDIECGDGAKYMSYIKVSKEQHERVKSSMKQSNTSIQSRSLNLVLGNLDGFCVKPYEQFEEEERHKLHDHWLHLAKKDLPARFENWKSWRAARWQLTVSLRKELDDKWKSNNVEENDISVCRPEAGHDARNKSSQHSGQSQDFGPETMNTNSDVITEITESDAFPSSLVDFPESINHADVSVGEQFPPPPPPSSAAEIWPLATLPNMYYPCISQSSFLPRRSDGGDSFFNPYASQDRTDLLLHSLFKDPGTSHYSGTDNFSRNLSPRLNIQQNIYSDGAGRFSIPREEHLLPLDQVQDWPRNSVVNVNLPMSAPPHQRLSQNWFSEDEVARDGWSGGVIPNHDIGGGGQGVDESLYSVLSECNGLRSRVPYGSTEIIQSGNYVDIGCEPVLSSSTVNGAPPRAARGLGHNYMSGNGNEGQLGWINLPRQRQ